MYYALLAMDADGARPMDEKSLQRAILDNPEDARARLAYADWLETDGQSCRADWIRASIEFASLSFRDPQWSQVGARVRECWSRCRPAWWEELKNVDQKNDRGTFRFVLGESRSARSLAAVKRLNKAAWLERAVDQGWLERIEAWVEEDFVRAITGWNAPVSKIPLHVAVAPQVGNDTLLKILQLPQLQGLVLPSNVLANEAAKEVAACTNLRDLTVQFRLVDASIVDAILARIISMPMLRRLCIKGHERPDHSARPSDQDLVLLGKLQTLKQLNLSSCSTVTDVGIAELQRVNPTLIISRNYEP